MFRREFCYRVLQTTVYLRVSERLKPTVIKFNVSFESWRISIDCMLLESSISLVAVKLFLSDSSMGAPT